MRKSANSITTQKDFTAARMTSTVRNAHHKQSNKRVKEQVKCSQKTRRGSFLGSVGEGRELLIQVRCPNYKYSGKEIKFQESRKLDAKHGPRPGLSAPHRYARPAA